MKYGDVLRPDLTVATARHGSDRIMFIRDDEESDGSRFWAMTLRLKAPGDWASPNWIITKWAKAAWQHE